MAERDPALRQIIRREFHRDPVTSQNAYTVPAQAPRQVS